jgi:hypothetical protein
MASEREGLSFCCLAQFSIATRVLEGRRRVHRRERRWPRGAVTKAAPEEELNAGRRARSSALHFNIARADLMRLPDRSSGSTSPRFSRHSRSRSTHDPFRFRFSSKTATSAEFRRVTRVEQWQRGAVAADFHHVLNQILDRLSLRSSPRGVRGAR